VAVHDDEVENRGRLLGIVPSGTDIQHRAISRGFFSRRLGKLFNISDSYADTPIRWFIVIAAPLRCALFANSTWAIQFAENLVAIATNLLLLKEVMNGNDGLAFPLKRVTETIFATI
jgi:hypothetical protein